MSGSNTPGHWTPAPGQTEAIQGAVASRLGNAWALLESAVRLDSSPDDADGLEGVVSLVRPWFDSLGLETSVERTSDGHPVLHAHHASPRRGEETRRLLMIGHLDTVFPPGTSAEWPFERAGDRARGPGVADAKGGAAVIWLAAAAALQTTEGLPGLDLQVILNTDEEAGSVESRPIFEREAQSADVALVYEPGRPDGTIVRQRRGARRYRISIAGKAAHTGVEPWAGVNAIESAAHKVLALQSLNDRDRFLSVTVAIAKGGTRINVVPDLAVLEVDTRLPDDESAAATHAAVEEIIHRADVPGSTASYEIVSDRPPLMPQPGVAGLLERFRSAGAALGLDIQDSATGGGSDGCFISHYGVPTIDALGPVGGGYHTRDEFILAASLQERAALSAMVLASLSDTDKP